MLQVRFMTQLNFDTHCEMDFTFFPFDRQVALKPTSNDISRFETKVCSINVESFGQGEEEINLLWNKDNIVDEIKLSKVNQLNIS